MKVRCIDAGHCCKHEGCVHHGEHDTSARCGAPCPHTVDGGAPDCRNAQGYREIPPRKLAVVDEPAAQVGIDNLQPGSLSDQFLTAAKKVGVDPAAITVSARELEVEPGKADKPCYGILFDFPRAMAGLARILLHGREKYGGTKAGRALPDTPPEPCYESLLRHYEAIRAGEEIDPDSGEPHVMCLLANAFLAADKWGYRG